MIAVHAQPAAFTAEECDRILVVADAAPAREARLVGQAQDHNLRRADLVWLDDVPGCDWVMDRIIDIVRAANRERFDFDLQSFSESAQIARYDASRAGHFDWHSDIGDGPFARQRKLTMVVQLSAPEGYAGGTLEVMPSAHVHQASTARGDATIFPSFLLHRVTPVTHGQRQSLTIWAHGPAFR